MAAFREETWSPDTPVPTDIRVGKVPVADGLGPVDVADLANDVFSAHEAFEEGVEGGVAEDMACAEDDWGRSRWGGLEGAGEKEGGGEGMGEWLLAEDVDRGEVGSDGGYNLQGIWRVSQQRAKDEWVRRRRG